MTQREVARKLGISRTLVQMIERSALAKLARALDVPAAPRGKWVARAWARKTARRRLCSLCGERGHFARACVAPFERAS